jgi:hypothetical protein
MACNDCNNPSTDCENPCGATVTNTAACESLSSQIQNFTNQFFGSVVKTEVEGVVTWSLPCDLAIGLPANPRAEGEGLACYFLRLFSEGIIGLKGDKGDAGATGSAGHSAYTVVLQSFTQPTIGSPNVTVLTSYNPSILASMYVFITGSGWYLVNNADISGTLSLTLTKAVSSPPATVIAGKLVIPSGYPGESIKGDKGDKGDTGATGSAAQSLTVTNVSYFATLGSDYALQVTYAAVDFVNSSPQVLLPVAGKYLVTAVITVLGATGVTNSDFATLKLRNTSTSVDVPGSEMKKNFIADTQVEQIVINITVTTTLNNQTIALFGKCTTASKIKAVALNTTLTAVRIQ